MNFLNQEDAENENEGGQAMKIQRYPTCQGEDRVIYLVFLEREKEKKLKTEKKAAAAGSQIQCNSERTDTEGWKH